MQHQTSYQGPTMSQIRQDQATRDKVQHVIEALKNVSPVFGQNNVPTVNTLPGISPLEQIRQQLTAPLPSQQNSSLCSNNFQEAASQVPLVPLPLRPPVMLLSLDPAFF